MAQSVPILVVEDEALVLLDVEACLEDGGYTVLTASNGREAIQLIERRLADIRALISDIDIGSGDISGWDIARMAREGKADLPVVYMTGASTAQWTSQGVPNSILLPKPFAMAQLIAAVSNLLNASAEVLKAPDAG